ncbi:MAG: cofactor-independent phosphoglycerate mutase [Deltaproteobacteria bacterium]
MKYALLLGDGMGDYPLEELGGKTPLSVAKTPNMDFIASKGTIGLLETIPSNLPPGSDVANLSILGYNPNDCYTGRGPLEAVNMGIKLGKDDVAFRCNLVSLSNNENPIMDDFTAGHISSSEAQEIIASLNVALADDQFKFYHGVGYRHLLVWRDGVANMQTTPPHDITGKMIAKYLPQGEGGDVLIDIMLKSQKELQSHHVNIERINSGTKPATSVWFWGQGKAPQIVPLTEKYSLKGAMISAVDLLNGMGICAGLEIIKVHGATGYIDTNYAGKAQSAIDALAGGMDFVFVHVEAPDEMGHQGNIKGKIMAIEDFDKQIVGKILNDIRLLGDFRVLVLSDHLTPIAMKTHVGDPTLFAMLSSNETENASKGYSFTEDMAKASGLFISPGHLLMNRFINGNIA